MDFRLLVMSGRIRNSPNELLDLKNVGVAVAISVISHSVPEIQCTSAFNPAGKAVSGRHIGFPGGTITSNINPFCSPFI